MGLSLHTVYRYARWGRLPQPAHVEGTDWAIVWFADDFRAWMEAQGHACND